MRDPAQLAQLRREECRREVRAYLAERIPLAFDPEAVRRSVNMATGLDFSDAEISAALDLLVSLGQATAVVAAIGASSSFKATAQGVLAHERGQ